MTYRLHPNSMDRGAYEYMTINEKGEYIFHPFALGRVDYLYARDKEGNVWVNDFPEWRNTGIKGRRKP